MLALLVPAVASAQPVVPGQPLGQPVGPGDSDILRRSSRSLPPATPPAPPAATPQAAVPGSLVQPDGRIVVTREMCSQLSVQYQPAPDVAYRPGTDVDGRPVVPADLPNSGASYGGLGSATSTDILIAPRAGGLNQRGVIGETYVGRVTVDPSGHVAINGQPIGPQDQTALRDLCARAGY
jgi:hypothetical protein